ncbi:MAG: hypothetical protein M5U34_49135 [Chloroflexi bacterium]|nr:hypothetical protein [Chloroflexota bacterium]
MTDPDQISGSVERITYYNEENGYSVIRLKPDTRGMLPFKYASSADALITWWAIYQRYSPGNGSNSAANGRATANTAVNSRLSFVNNRCLPPAKASSATSAPA